MSASALAKRLESTRRTARQASEVVERRLVIASTAAGVGWLERRKTLPVEVLGVPSKLAVGIGATLLEANSSGATRRMSGAIADMAFALYGYAAAKTASMIAGEESGDVGGEDYVGEELS